MFGESTTGAESDIQQVTRIARGMVERWGMSEKVGFLTVAPQDGQSPLLPGADPVSEATQELIDGEVRRIVDQEMELTEQLLSENRDKLDSLAETLLERETLDEADAYAAAGIERGARRGPMSDLIDPALAEDIGEGDLTTRAVVPDGAQAKARISQKAPGVIAGLRVAEAVFQRVDPELVLRDALPAGLWREGGAVAEISGAAASIVTAERVALNFLGHLSGVATLTARYVRAVEGTGVRILDTRKTMPGLRALEKEAVRAGGGESHRSGLYDAILVKENHAKLAGGVGEAGRRALEARAGRRDGRGGVRDARRGPGGAGGRRDAASCSTT